MEDLLKRFGLIDLQDIDSVKTSLKLMRRHDTKFVFPVQKLKPLLESLMPFYRVLDIGGRRIFGYGNLYFDFPSFFFYLEHHNGRFPRQKVRFRKYMDSGLCYFEIKTKSNKRETSKERFRSPMETELGELHLEFARPRVPFLAENDLESMEPKILTSFKRITLVGHDPDERITIDTDVSFKDMDDNEFRLRDVAVAESKHSSNVIGTPFIKVARDLRIFEERFSKYCTGISALYTKVRSNRFKNRLRRIVKINGGYLNGIS